LEGHCWDGPRSLSNTYTPDCCASDNPDPACNGLCGNEYRPSAAEWGNELANPSFLWPPDAILDPSPSGPPYSGDYWLDIIYYDDNIPGAWFHGMGNPTLNEVKWLHMACVEPIEAPQIAVSPGSVVWPEWVQFGSVESFPVTVTNRGNVALDVWQVNTVEHTGSGWLATTVSSLMIPGCDNNTGTFDIQIFPVGYTSPEWLEGEVELVSNDPDNPSLIIPIRVLVAGNVEAVWWDTVTTSEDWGSFPSAVDDVGLTCSNHGSLGHKGIGGVNLDFMVSGRECDPAATVYLYDASPYVMLGESDLTTSHWTDGYAKSYVFKPQATTDAMTHGASDDWDSVYVGQMVNRDSSVAIERTVYAPRNEPETPSFVVSKLVVYSFDGLPHEDFTLGSAADWDVPSTVPARNTAVLIPDQWTVAVRGTGASECRDNSQRYGMEVFLGWYSESEHAVNPAVNHTEFYGSVAVAAHPLLNEQSTPEGPEPNASEWYTQAATNPGINILDMNTDLAVLTTYVYDITLPAAEKLTFYTAYVSISDDESIKTDQTSSISDVNEIIQNVRNWYAENMRAGCCVGHVGDANGEGGDEPTIGDINALISAIYTNQVDDAIAECFQEADVNQSGGMTPVYPDDFTITDINLLIEYLYIKGPYDPDFNPTGAQLLECF